MLTRDLRDNRGRLHSEHLRGALACVDFVDLRATNVDHRDYDDLRPTEALPSGNCIVRTIPCPSFT